MKVGVLIDPYKLETFKRKLAEVNFTFDEPVKGPANTLLIRVHTDDVASLAKITSQANKESRH